MVQQDKHLTDEADIGSGEKSPGQEEVERDEQSLASRDNSKQVPDAKSNGSTEQGRMLQSGTHLARIVAAAQPDGTFEARVYVRLTREPEVAETFIPAGTYPTEAEAWTAAEERAKRAFEEHEF